MQVVEARRRHMHGRHTRSRTERAFEKRGTTGFLLGRTDSLSGGFF
jgi:hypothetical protein